MSLALAKLKALQHANRAQQVRELYENLKATVTMQPHVSAADLGRLALLKIALGEDYRSATSTHHAPGKPAKQPQPR